VLILALAVGFCVALVIAWYHGERGKVRRCMNTAWEQKRILSEVTPALSARVHKQSTFRKPPSLTGAKPRFSASAPISAAAPSSSLARNTILLPPCTAGFAQGR